MTELRTRLLSLRRISALVLTLCAFQLSAFAQTIGTCQQPISVSYLNVNNVRALVRSSGNLFDFDSGLPVGYEVPTGSGKHAIFAAFPLVMGQLNGELAGLVGDYVFYGGFWSGPVFPGAAAPPNCDVYDRIYKIDREDLVAYENGESAPTDLADWPTGLGAPTMDAEGNRIVLTPLGALAHVDISGDVQYEENLTFSERLERTIDLASGERPEMVGDQMLWWIMNDLGSNERPIDTRPAGLELHGTAFAFNVPGALGNTTFYRFRVVHKGLSTLENAYIGMFFDSELGYNEDDYVGIDTTLSLGFAYNADNNDDGQAGYGTSPPAIGVDLFRGPTADPDGIDNDRDGQIDEEGERLEITSFVRSALFEGPDADPVTAEEYYNVMQGRFKSGLPMTVGGDGRGFSSKITTFQFPGAPETREFWSQINSDGQGTPLEPLDTRFRISSGPITFEPGDEQEIVFGIVWSRGTDHLDSVRQLKIDDAVAQAAFDTDFDLATVPSAPRVTATPLDGKVILEWTSRPSDNNFLDAYSEKDALAPGHYVFEGYKVFQYESPLDQEGTLIATYDVVNGIKRVIDGLPGEPSSVVAVGTDSGVQHTHVVDELSNYRTYFFGVQAYAYNAPSIPKVYGSPVTRVEVIPTRIDARGGGTKLQSELDSDIAATVVSGFTDGIAGAQIVNPLSITGHEYHLVFFEDTLAVDGSPVVNYDIVDSDTGEKIFGGRDALRRIESNGQISSSSDWVAFSQRENVVTIDGLQLSVTGPNPGLKGFITTANAAGLLEPPDMAAYSFAGSGFPIAENTGLIPPGSRPQPDRPTRGYQQSSNDSAWGFHTGGPGWFDYGDESGAFNVDDNGFIGRVVRNGWEPIGSDDYEWRFTQHCFDAIDGAIGPGDCLAFRAFEDYEYVEIPFEVWNVGPSSDPSDDYRMIPIICESACGAGTEDYTFDLTDVTTETGDHAISGGADDPYTDLIYLYKPEDNGETPGEQGYIDFFFDDGWWGQRTYSRLVLVNWNGGSERPYTAELPEPGTVFRVVSKKPNPPGLVFSIDTAGYEAITNDAGVARNALDEIGIVPNPYKGASAYEVSHRADEVRFTNMPPQATIRVFDLAGTLVRRLDKNSPEAFFRWDLRTDDSLPIASGMYFIHVDVPGVGERALKFAVVRKGTRIQTF